MPVKPKFIKEIGAKIVEEYPDAVSKEFDQNKEIVNEVVDLDSKPVRNKIAGHVTRLQIQISYNEE